MIYNQHPFWYRLVIEEVLIGEACPGKSLESFGELSVVRWPALLVQEEDSWTTVKKKRQVTCLLLLTVIHMSSSWTCQPFLRLHQVARYEGTCSVQSLWEGILSHQEEKKIHNEKKIREDQEWKVKEDQERKAWLCVLDPPLPSQLVPFFLCRFVWLSFCTVVPQPRSVLVRSNCWKRKLRSKRNKTTRDTLTATDTPTRTKRFQ